MKTYIKKSRMMKNVFYLIAMIFTVAFINSCQETELSFENTDINGFSKQQLIEIYTTYSDERIGALDIDIDELIESNFTLAEREELLVERVNNFLSKSVAKDLNGLLSEYREVYNESYLDETSAFKEEFAEKHLKKSGETNKSSGPCNSPWLSCTNCDVYGDYIYYQQNRCASKPIVAYGCNAQANDPTDCDNSYYWEATWYEYVYPNKHYFTWYTDNIVYRALMADGISGFKPPASSFSSFEYSTFFGSQHKTAANFAWFFSLCPQDEWMAVTEFGAELRGTSCYLPPGN